MKANLNDRMIKAATRDISDAVVPGLALRVTPGGAKSFVLVARFPGSSNPTRRSMGAYGALSLAQARDKAREWIALLQRGVDPATTVEQERQENLRKQSNTLAAIYEVYKHKRIIGPDPSKPNMRQHARLIHNFEDILLPMFGDRPITEITAREVTAALDEIEKHGTDQGLINLGIRKTPRRPNRTSKPSPQQARILFVNLDTFLTWAVGTDNYGLEISPLHRVRKQDAFQARGRRERFLNEEEIGAVWNASGKLPAPYRQFYRLLMLTGLRLSEVREASWTEFNHTMTEWTIPAERMKGRNGLARAHTVPLTPLMREVLKEVPRGPKGAFVFSANLGASAIAIGGNYKDMLDDHLVKGEHFTNHDLRRTLRTLGSKLGIGGDVGEAILAHRRTGVAGIYDQDDRLDERRKAHVMWGEFLLKCSNKRSSVVRLTA